MSTTRQQLIDQLRTAREAHGMTLQEFGAVNTIFNVELLETNPLALPAEDLRRATRSLGLDLEFKIVEGQVRTVHLDLQDIAHGIDIPGRQTSPRQYACIPGPDSTVVLGGSSKEPGVLAIEGSPGAGKSVALACLVDALLGRANLVVADHAGEVFQYLQLLRSSALPFVEVGGTGNGSPAPVEPAADHLPDGFRRLPASHRARGPGGTAR